MVERRASEGKIVDPGSIFDLVMRRWALWKDTLFIFSIGAEQSIHCPTVVAQPDERLVNRTKKVFCVGVVRHT